MDNILCKLHLFNFSGEQTFIVYTSKRITIKARLITRRRLIRNWRGRKSGKKLEKEEEEDDSNSATLVEGDAKVPFF